MKKRAPGPSPEGAQRAKVVLLAAVAVVFAFVLYESVHALFPLVNDVQPSGDDWYSYHRNAVSVVSDGLSMPVVQGAYTRPGGFGYVYFVAAWYKLFGARSRVVYVVQAILLLASVALFAFAARRKLLLLPFAAYAVALAVFAFLDTFRYYTFHLLSENLLLFLFALLFLALASLTESSSWVAAAVVGLLCGACFLTRPNTILLAPALALVHVWRGRDKRSLRDGAVICAGLLVMALAIVWRDSAVTGRLAGLHVLTATNDWQHPSSAGAALTFYLRRVRFVLGDLPALVPAFPQWTHWYFAWAGVALFAVIALIRRHLDALDAFALTLLAAYYVPLIAVGQIENYGIRMVMPGMPFVLYLAARGLTELRPTANG